MRRVAYVRFAVRSDTKDVYQDSDIHAVTGIKLIKTGGTQSNAEL